MLREMQCEQARPFAFTEPGGRLPAFFRMLGNNAGAYLAEGRRGMFGDLGFVLDDFKTYIAGLRKPD